MTMKTKTTTTVTKSKLYGYFFHYNDQTGLWAAFETREIKNYTEKMYPHVGTKALFNSDLKLLIQAIEDHETTMPNIYKQFGLNEPQDGLSENKTNSDK
jgi:hypothetical protein